jgi:hypothetical protein
LHGIVRRVPGAAPGGAGRVARLARQALRADPVLAELGIRVVPVAAGAVELHGWVATRALRARALRTVREAPMVDRVINHLLVRGEDDTPSPDATPTSEQTA